jgi:amidophosphoribosyltransferase
VKKLEGAYSFVALSSKKMIGCRDPLGIRPLVLGDLEGSWILASETCALDIMGARYVRDVEARAKSSSSPRRDSKAISPSSRRNAVSAFSSMSISRARQPSRAATSMKRARTSAWNWQRKNRSKPILSCRFPIQACQRRSVMRRKADLPFELGIIRNHYVGRTFIQPTDSIRHMGVKLKHNANRHSIEGKRVILVDDSIVRGTTSQKIVQMVREAGAKEVHMRIASPPTISSCYYGVDTPETKKLLASRMSVEEMANSSASTRWASCRSTASTAPSAKRARTNSRSSATPVSPAPIRPVCSIATAPTMCASCRSSPAETDPSSRVLPWT